MVTYSSHVCAIEPKFDRIIRDERETNEKGKNKNSRLTGFYRFWCLSFLCHFDFLNSRNVFGINWIYSNFFWVFVVDRLGRWQTAYSWQLSLAELRFGMKKERTDTHTHQPGLLSAQLSSTVKNENCCILHVCDTARFSWALTSSNSHTLFSKDVEWKNQYNWRKRVGS